MHPMSHQSRGLTALSSSESSESSAGDARAETHGPCRPGRTMATHASAHTDTRPATRVRVVIVDRSPLLRDGLAGLLSSRGHEVVLSASGWVGVPEALGDAPADVVLIDSSATDPRACRELHQLKTRRPTLRVLVLQSRGSASSPDDGAGTFDGMIDGVIDGVVARTAGLTYLERAVAGRIACPSGPPRTTERPAVSLGSLTTREREVLGLLAAGSSTRVIAKSLGIEPSTVYAHVRALLHKCGARSRLEVVSRFVHGDLVMGAALGAGGVVR